MVKTDGLIKLLVTDLQPVRRLHPPLLRCACWLAFAIVIIAMIAMSHGIRPDLAQRFQDPLFSVRVVAAVVTGILAALSGFLVSLPDRSGRWAFLPTPALAIWCSTIGYGCLTDWISLGPNDVQFGKTISCLATLILTGAPLSLAMFLMMRHSGPFRPTTVTVCCSLAVAALTATALSLFHSLDATALVLMWNLGVALLYSGLGAVFGERLFGCLETD